MHFTYDAAANAAYLSLVENVDAGESVSQVVVEDPRLRGEIILDLDKAGFLLGVEVLGATDLLRSDTLTSNPTPL